MKINPDPVCGACWWNGGQQKVTLGRRRAMSPSRGWECHEREPLSTPVVNNDRLRGR